MRFFGTFRSTATVCLYLALTAGVGLASWPATAAAQGAEPGRPARHKKQADSQREVAGLLAGRRPRGIFGETCSSY